MKNISEELKKLNEENGTEKSKIIQIKKKNRKYMLEDTR